MVKGLRSDVGSLALCIEFTVLTLKCDVRSPETASMPAESDWGDCEIIADLLESKIL
jgi:hypothetical protein